MNLTSILDFQDADKNIDWAAYRASQISNGEACMDCGKMIPFGKGHPSKCGACERISDDNDEISHDKYIRCPKCRHQWDETERDNYEIYNDGEHQVSCPECEHDFEISTDVSFWFTSPEML